MSYYIGFGFQLNSTSVCILTLLTVINDMSLVPDAFTALAQCVFLSIFFSFSRSPSIDLVFFFLFSSFIVEMRTIYAIALWFFHVSFVYVYFAIVTTSSWFSLLLLSLTMNLYKKNNEFSNFQKAIWIAWILKEKNNWRSANTYSLAWLF